MFELVIPGIMIILCLAVTCIVDSIDYASREEKLLCKYRYFFAKLMIKIGAIIYIALDVAERLS